MDISENTIIFKFHEGSNLFQGGGGGGGGRGPIAYS